VLWRSPRSGRSTTRWPQRVEEAIIEEPLVAVGERLRRHPYVRLALNPSFSALWAGGVISLFGDRVHQIALAFLVLAVTHSPVAVAFVFVAATLPNLFFSPIAGTYVDRWDQKDVMVVSDLLRAAIILIIPIAAVTNILVVYPLVFLVTSISIFFRPARIAALPRIVREDELLTANSAMWIGETIADVIGYPLAAIFVGFLGSALPLAFWFDAATYAASAALIATIVVPPLKNADIRTASARP
jgi:MFS family permease